jgi:ubiquinone biosynthesis protein
VRHGTLPGFGWLTPLLDELGRSGTLAFPEETALFRKSLLTLTGVIHDVWPHASIDQVLMAGGARQFIAESWLRPLAPFEPRIFGTHLSSEDALRIMSTLAWTPARYLLETGRSAQLNRSPYLERCSTAAVYWLVTSGIAAQFDCRASAIAAS